MEPQHVPQLSGASAEQDLASVETIPVGGTCKRLFDLVVACLLIAMFIPLFACLALIILGIDGRPVFVLHRRVGFNGQGFLCAKFRTMTVNNEAVLRDHVGSNPEAAVEWQTTGKLRNDPRVTALGRVLRKSSADELPQLWNIVRGEMSLVGPRPIVEAELSRFGSYLHDYFRARPGLTGLWQIEGRSNSGYDERVLKDSTYVREWSFLRDLKIVAKTVPAVLSSRGSY